MEHSLENSSPTILRGGKRLNAWIEAGGPATRPVKLRSLQHLWFGYWFERYKTITGARCAPVDLPSNPVFIVGLWRTGSTALHSALARGAHWTTPRTWQCFRPADFLLSPAPPQRNVVRPMDAGVIETFSPQEDEFAALLLGETSTYRAFIDPRRLNELASLLNEWRTCADSEVAPLSPDWETFLRAVLMQSPGRLLLKSPNHTFRLPWLAKRFPHARFIWLTRPTAALWESNKRMWTLMIERYGQWPLDASLLDSFLQRAISAHDDILHWARQSIGDRLYEAAFDDVVNKPTELLADLYAKLESSNSPIDPTAALAGDRHTPYETADHPRSH